MAGRKIRDSADAQVCLAAAAASGMGRARWAREQGVDGRSLNAWWLNLVGRRKARIPGSPRLRLVELVPHGPVEPARYTVRVGGVEIELDDRFSDDTLRRLLGVVVAPC